MLGYLIFSILVIGGLYGLYRWWHKRIDAELNEGAAYEYQRLQKAEPELLEGMSEADFSEIFHMVEVPRAPGYAFSIISSFLVGTPLMLAFLSFGDWAMNRFGVIPNPDVVAGRFFTDSQGQTRFVKDVPPEALQYYVQDLGGFYYFFGMLIFWVAIVWFFMRRYHQRRPGLLRDELLRSR